MPEPKDDLRTYLQRARDALRWKLDGVDDYGLRRPMTPTATNLLGLIKHVAGVEAGYFGATFGRPFPEPMPWLDDDAPDNADMWATPEQSVEDITSLYQRVCMHSDATIEALPLEATGRVPWWPAERAEVTLHRVLVHVIGETERHAGHADIVRELVDGATGLRPSNANLPDGDPQWWQRYFATVDAAARVYES